MSRPASRTRVGLIRARCDENPLADAFPGQHVELELPRQGQLPLKVEGEIVYVTPEGRIGVRVTSPLPVDSLGGRIPL